MNSKQAGRVRLGDVEVDLRSGELYAVGPEGGERKILLREQPFQVLRMLIEQEGEIVTREDVRKKLWPNDTTVNFDHSINVAIGILRRTIGDSAESPRYIETVARRGYRLRVAVEWLETTAEMPLTAATSPPSSGHPARTTAPGKRLVAIALLLCLALAGGIFEWLHRQAPLAPNQTIVIGIHNETRDPAFNDALYVPLDFAMEQTPYFTALPLTKAAPAFKALHLSGDPMELSPQTARQVCIHTASQLVIAGTLAEAGNGFKIELQALECRSGRTLAAASAEASSRSQVVHALGLVAAKLRVKLGEPEASITQFNKPLEQAASASPEALELLLEGYKRSLAADFSGAASDYQRAVDLDPNFAAALSALGTAEQGLGQDTSSTTAVTRAYQLRNRLTDPGRLEAESLYDELVTGDFENACAVLSQVMRRFPDDFIAHNNLRLCLESIGQLDGALAEAREAARLYPSAFSYNALVILEISTGRLDEANAKLAEADGQEFDNTDLRERRATLAFLQHDNAKMEQLWKWAEGKPGADYRFHYLRGLTEAYDGHYGAYRKLSKQAREMAANDAAFVWIPSYDTGDAFNIDDALEEAAVGNLPRARALLSAESGQIKLQNRVNQVILALACAFAGETAQAQDLANAIDQRAPVNTVVQHYFLPAIRAALELDAKDPAQAIKILEGTRRYDLAAPFGSFINLYPTYIRGLAYLQNHQGALAQMEFQKILDHPGLTGIDVIEPLSRLQLARALQLNGDTAAARKSYQDFLDLWKGADPDLPIYRQAKAEYALISSTQRVSSSHQAN